MVQNEQVCSQCGAVNAPRSRYCSDCGYSLTSVPVDSVVRLNSISMAPTIGVSTDPLLHGRYRVIEMIGRGGFSPVYKAEDETFPGRRIVAIKEMTDSRLDPSAKAQVRQDLRHEASLLARLQHPNLSSVIDFFEEDGKAYLVMEFIEGKTLEKIQDEQRAPLDEGQVMNWALQLCKVLSYLHTRSHPIIFRDMKPANVMRMADEQIKLIDFGIARIFKAAATKDTTRLGSHGYTPLEQYGHGQSDVRSDIYALGATLYHLLTKQVPVDAPSRHNNPTLLSPPRQLNPKLSPAVEAVILKAMAEEPRDRYQTADDMYQDVFAIINVLRASTTPVSPPPSSYSPPSLNPNPLSVNMPRTPTLPVSPSPPSYSPPSPNPVPALPSTTRRRSSRLRRILLPLCIVLLVGLLVLSLVMNIRGVKLVDALRGGNAGPIHTLIFGSPTPTVPALNANTISQLGKKWVFQTGGFVHSSPVVADGVVYVGSGDHSVYAIDAQSGKQKWAFQTGDTVTSWPAVVDGVVYVGSKDDNVYAIDAQSGRKKWAFPTGDSVGSSPAVVDGVVYIGSADDNVYAIDAQSGKQKWAFPTGDIVTSSPAVVDGVVYIGSADDNVYAIDAHSGKQKWAFPTGKWVYSSPEVVDGVVYIGSDDKNVYAIDAQSGKQKWAFPTARGCGLITNGRRWSSLCWLFGFIRVCNRCTVGSTEVDIRNRRYGRLITHGYSWGGLYWL